MTKVSVGHWDKCYIFFEEFISDGYLISCKIDRYINTFKSNIYKTKALEYVLTFERIVRFMWDLVFLINPTGNNKVSHSHKFQIFKRSFQMLFFFLSSH